MFDTGRFWGLAMAVTSLAIVYTVGYVIYNIAFHPLSGFPGPWSAGYTRIPYWIAAIKGNQVTYMRQLHERYGSVVRFSPDELSYTDPQAWKDICEYRKGVAECLKAPEAHLPPLNGKIPALKTVWSHVLHYLGVPHLITVGTNDHDRIRRIFSPAFSDRALKQQEPLFRRHIDLFINKLYQIGDLPVDMVKMFTFTTFDAMGDLTFGQPLGLLEDIKFSPWVQAVFDSVRILPFIQMIEYYPTFKYIFSWLEPESVKKMRTSHFRHTADRVDLRLQKGSDQPDIWNLVISARDGKGLILDEMYSNAELFMLAGSETSATCLSGLLYFLLKDPEKMRIVIKEIREHFATSTVNIQGLAGLKYLNASIQETLRLYPPVPVGIPRYIPEGGRMIAGKWIAPAIRVSVHQAAASRSPANFKNPDIFAPERWLGDEAYADDKRDACQPFSTGPRNCLGQNMAWHEIRLIFATFIATFDVELCKDCYNWVDQKVYGIWAKKPLMCRVTPKNSQ